ncbi:MYG1 family protein [Candidatus Parcubacteria bacterium]|nr:MYG1 family protein [Candidatus Parcubacteria bacterium]
MKTLKIVTHNGDFHSDDIFAVAVLSLAFEKEAQIEIVRTRDASQFASADFLVDIGGINDVEKNRFDHHQAGGAGARENGIPFASAGLVWKKYGELVCGSLEIAKMIDEKLVTHIDANDNGVNIYSPVFPNILPYTIQDLVHIFRPTWKEDLLSVDKTFLEMVAMAKKIITREIVVLTNLKEAEDLVGKEYELTEDKRLIIFSQKYPWYGLMKHPEPLFVIYQDGVNDLWRLKAISDGSQVFKNRKDLPASWAGKRDKELADTTGVPDALFCHNKLFLAVAKSKEGALALAKIALEN